MATVSFRTKEEIKLLHGITKLAQKQLMDLNSDPPNINLGMNLTFNKRDLLRKISEIDSALNHVDIGTFAIAVDMED